MSCKVGTARQSELRVSVVLSGIRQETRANTASFNGKWLALEQPRALDPRAPVTQLTGHKTIQRMSKSSTAQAEIHCEAHSLLFPFPQKDYPARLISRSSLTRSIQRS